MNLLVVVFVLFIVLALVCAVHEEFSELHVGTTGSGKSNAAAQSVAKENGASLNADPHENSFARRAAEAAQGNILFDRLSDKTQWLAFGLMSFLSLKDRFQAERFVELFTAILLLYTGADSVTATPLKEEWLVSSLLLVIHQKLPKSPLLLPFAFLPGTKEFEELVRDCILPEIKAKFQALEKLTPRALRAEVGSASRLVNAVFRSEAFRRRCQGGFDLAAFYQNKGKLIIEAGSEITEAARSVIISTLVVLTIEIAKRRAHPYPVIKIRLDEANNARLVTNHVLKGIAELRKYGVFFEFYVQNLNFPGNVAEILQNCRIHHWYACASRELARQAAIDVAAGLSRDSEDSRADFIEGLTDEILFLKPGWRWSRYPWGSKKEYVPLVESPYPNWPGLRETMFQKKLADIFSRPEYMREAPCPTSAGPNSGDSETPPSSPSSPVSPPPAPKSGSGFSPASHWKQKRKKPASGSSSNESESESPW